MSGPVSLLFATHKLRLSFAERTLLRLSRIEEIQTWGSQLSDIVLDSQGWKVRTHLTQFWNCVFNWELWRQDGGMSDCTFACSPLKDCHATWKVEKPGWNPALCQAKCGHYAAKIHIAIFWPQTYLMIKFSKLCMYNVQLFIKQIFKASSDQQ